ncbi:hypothetical protein A2230_03405 [candidate division WOR-1 bacterium RIFOXYA2_FULL_36_21]|uniref:DUF362 domain-containing protein n=1 Tax=candidate division WOR-1 bacterium RIFOXYB2_FULL_36_35 TaxID=1802578 RepID=A0A1F4S124_UNCSA|nr:MAG: hypothetical protein A2230_03405 [candidate division WOR-1 bacterium RIFOXYA2_FULL_36_21]OGC14145.1 MAG: hypothetical protein A2290_00515 [candidate division WOR-1 bacterium RIFOXYB2_FULL_36_35]OGC15367.1 MAG: hypothetical protein A2282_01505 [candidate division WOR-1 bacterium RIFOXYA12_FULL_36_13]
MFSQKIFAAKSLQYPSREALHTTITRGLQGIGITSETMRGKKVLIKPNLAGPSSVPHQYSMTSRDLMIAMARFAQEGGASEVIIADHCAGYTNQLYHVPDYIPFFSADIGLESLAQQHNIAFYDLHRVNFEEREGLFFPALLNDPNLLIINMTLPKTHHQDFLSLCLKNLGMGLTDNRDNMHQNLSKSIIRANNIIRYGMKIPVIDIVDGRFGQDGMGPHFGNPVDPTSPFILFGTDPVAVDATAARLMGFDPYNINTIRLGHNTILGHIDRSVLGDINELTPTKFTPSPAWEFSITEDRRAILFWLDEDGIGRLRIYTLNERLHQFILNREKRILFRENITKDEADDIVFGENHSDIINDPDFVYYADPAVEFFTESDNNTQTLSGLRGWISPSTYNLGCTIAAAAKNTRLEVTVAYNEPQFPNRGEASSSYFLTYNDESQQTNYSPNQNIIIPGSSSLARKLYMAGIRRMNILKGIRAMDFETAVKQTLYNDMTRKEQLIAAGMSIAAIGSIYTAARSGLFYLMQSFLGF